MLVLAVILAIVGIIGSVVPGIPGPPLGWLGLLCAYVSKSPDPVSQQTLIIALIIVSAVTVLDYILPASMTRRLGGHKAASIGATLGLFAGMFLTPIGMIAGSILGAFLAELLVEDAGVWNSFKASIGAFIGFILTTGLKLMATGWIFYIVVTHIR